MLLEMKNLCKSYGETIALDRLNLQLTPGIYGLLGPNGAGKSTLMKLICMLIQPTDGFVLFDGEDIRMHRSNFFGPSWIHAPAFLSLPGLYSTGISLLCRCIKRHA